MWKRKKRSSRRRRSSLLKSGKAIRSFARGFLLEALGAAVLIFLFFAIRIRPIEQEKRLESRTDHPPASAPAQENMANRGGIFRSP